MAKAVLREAAPSQEPVKSGDTYQLLMDAGLLAETLASEGQHGQAAEAGDTGCQVCDAIWRIRQAVDDARLTIVIGPSDLQDDL